RRGERRARGESGDGPRSEERRIPHRSRRGPQPRRVHGLRSGVPQRQQHGSRGQGRVLPEIGWKEFRKANRSGECPLRGLQTGVGQTAGRGWRQGNQNGSRTRSTVSGYFRTWGEGAIVGKSTQRRRRWTRRAVLQTSGGATASGAGGCVTR